MTDGKAHDGLITAEGPAVIEFVEVHQPAGKPVGLVVLSIDRKSIETWTRLAPEQRAALATRIEGFRHRARIEAGRMDDLRLDAFRRDKTVSWQYHGDWFSLESTADEAMTRQSIVRIEQLFTAFRQILPPRLNPQTRLQILLFGDTAEYRQFLGGRGLDLQNPAFFAADFNLVAAGSDMNRFVAELAKIRSVHQELRKEYARLLAETPGRLKDLNETLRKAGVPTEERQKISVAEQRKWKDEVATLEARIKAAERRNANRFQEVTGEMFGRLAHESFHAYLENFVYPRSSSDVPRWLNEGLAQTFEAGQLDGDSLRVDAPDARMLARLKSDLRASNPICRWPSCSRPTAISSFPRIEATEHSPRGCTFTHGAWPTFWPSSNRCWEPKNSSSYVESRRHGPVRGRTLRGPRRQAAARIPGALAQRDAGAEVARTPARTGRRIRSLERISRG